MLRLHENDTMPQGMDPLYFSPLNSPALERFPPATPEARRTQSMIGLSNIPANRRPPENNGDAQRNIRRAAYSPVARAQVSRKRNSITSLNLNANGSQSENSSDSVSPEPLPTSSMPPPPPRNPSSTKLYEKSATNGRHQKSQRQKRNQGPNSDVSPATPSLFLNMTLPQNQDHQAQGAPSRMEGSVGLDHGPSTETSPATVKSASSTPTFGPASAGPSMGSPSFIAIPASYDPNIPAVLNLNVTTTVRHPVRQSRRQSRSSSSSPAFKPFISPNLKPLLPGGMFSAGSTNLTSRYE